MHRDIKPANVMITEDGVVKIVDFGLTKLRGRTQRDTTALKWCNEILEIDEESLLGIRRLADIYVQQGKYKRAFEQGMKLLSENPEDLLGLYLAGEAEMLMGNYAEARKYFEKRIEISQREEFGTRLRLGYTHSGKWTNGMKHKQCSAKCSVGH